LDPENNQFLVETNLSSPTTGRVYVKLLESKFWGIPIEKEPPPYSLFLIWLVVEPYPSEK